MGPVKERERGQANSGSSKGNNTHKKIQKMEQLGDLVDIFHDQIWRYRKYHFNIPNQHNHPRHLREHLTEKDYLIHADFSENYEDKLSSEIQSMHFEASQTPSESSHRSVLCKCGQSDQTHSLCYSFRLDVARTSSNMATITTYSL